MAIIFVSFGAIASQWSVLKESATYIAILSCSTQLAAVITMPLAGVFCESLGWRSLYYLLGTFGVLSTVAFLFLYRDDPKKHRYDAVKDQIVKRVKVSSGPMKWRLLAGEPCAHVGDGSKHVPQKRAFYV
uniref:MFS domain-containing protein n=1 Tax=Angiostrongylus cantonensis TaxID=6313 RepID=A0A0K0D3T1_ANGCA